MAALPILSKISSFQGILNVPMYELPWTMPAEVNTAWVFNKGDTYPVIQKQRRYNGVTAAWLTEFNAWIGNQFTRTYTKFPTSTVSWADLYQTGTQGPVFVYDRLWGLLGTSTASDWYDYFFPAFAGLLNTVAHSMPKRHLWNKTADGRGGVSEAPEGSSAIVIARQQLPNPITLGMAKFTADNLANIRVLGRQYYDDYVFYDNLFTAPAVAGFSPLYNLPDVKNYRNYMVLGLNSAYAQAKRPGMFEFTGGGNFVYDSTALFYQIYFDDLTANELNQMYDASVTPSTSAAWASGATYIGNKHIWPSPNVNSRTPNQNYTVIALNQDGSKYWLLQFIPQDANAAKVVGAPTIHASAISFAGDIDGNLYMGLPNTFDGTISTVISSKGFYFPFPFLNPQLYGPALPCYGSCLPVTIPTQKI